MFHSQYTKSLEEIVSDLRRIKLHSMLEQLCFLYYVCLPYGGMIPFVCSYVVLSFENVHCVMYSMAIIMVESLYGDIFFFHALFEFELCLHFPNLNKK